MQKESRGMLASIKSITVYWSMVYYSLSEEKGANRKRPVEGKYFSFARDIRLRHFAESKIDITALMQFDYFPIINYCDLIV